MGDLMAGPEKSHVTPVSGAHRYESYRSNEAFLCMPFHAKSSVICTYCSNMTHMYVRLTRLHSNEAFFCMLRHMTPIDRKNPPLQGGFPIYYVP